MKECYLDVETFSEVPISHGTYAYAEGATCELLSYAFSWEPDDAEHIFEPDIEPIPADLQAAIDDPEVVFIAHNAQFDRVILEVSMGIHIPIERWRCSMACARSLGLPGALEKLGEIVGLPEDKQKLKRGKQLVQKFCKPAGKRSKVHRYDRYNSPEEWAEYKEYNKGDSRALRALWAKLPKWNYTGSELASWHLDQIINDRGIAIDLPFVHRALEATKAKQKEINADMAAATLGLVTTAGKRDALLSYLNDVYDVGLTDLKGSTVEGMLENVDIPEELREILLLRIRGTKTSIGKYKKISEAVSNDGRLKGTIAWNGAARTGRMAGRTVQPQNFPRPTMKNNRVALGIEAAMLGCEDLMFGDDIMDFYASALRGTFIAPPGRKLVVSDLSNIEGRMLAWLAGEGWKLHAFREFDAGRGPDLYKLAYANMFKVDPLQVGGDSEERQVGKVSELACIAEGQLVLTDGGLVPIEDVSTSMRVWDGVEFVQHEGAVCRGLRCVLTYDGLTATADHVVWAHGETFPLPFGEVAASRGYLRRAGVGVDGYAMPADPSPAAPTRTMARVYDVLNAGPRNRFTVSGRLVHNCGYGGGVGAFTTFALAYGIDLDEMADRALSTMPDATRAKAQSTWDWAVENKRTLGLSEKAFVTCDSFKRLWRDAHINVVRFWYAVDAAFRAAVANPGETFTAGEHIAMRYVNPWLGIRLPSGRVLTYYQPKVDPDSGELSYMGINQFTKKWQRIKTYFGRLVENLTQAAARDVLVANMPLVETAGYDICLTVHDEDITEAPDSPVFNVKHLSSILATVPTWAPGLPLAASGFEGPRYRK